jgi:hypothetical protein
MKAEKKSFVCANFFFTRMISIKMRSAILIGPSSPFLACIQVGDGKKGKKNIQIAFFSERILAESSFQE